MKIPFNLIGIQILCYSCLIDTLLIPSLPIDHFKYWLRNNKDNYLLLKSLCQQQKYELIQSESPNDNIIEICSQIRSVSQSCWGYERNESDCVETSLYSKPECDGESYGWAANQVQQTSIFYSEADFGYVGERIRELTYYCKPLSNVSSQLSSSLECIDYLRFCRSRNIFIDLNKLTTIEEPMRYRDDVIEPKGIGGYNCELDVNGLKSQGQHKSPLQSWFAEIENFHVFNDNNLIECDVWIEKPTFIMKLDATVNMYHHFCDFINLYATFHLNNSFFMDNNILIWDTYNYRSNFGVVWDGFTRNQILNLGLYKGKKVCFRDVIFTLLPRMIYGIYYNMPLIPGCSKSGLFHAFNRHVLHKLNVKTVTPADESLVRITLISRQTKYRRILNEDELLEGLTSRLANITVRKYDFNHRMPFIEQITISSNSDILIGMHGAGLTHCLFQPDWAVLFELYNCDDANCYQDLARLRGVKYMTWSSASKVYPEDNGEHPELGAHQKFTNYRFDVEEFVRLVTIAVEHVRSNRIKQIAINNASHSKDEL